MHLLLSAVGIIFLLIELKKPCIYNLVFACSFLFTSVFYYKYTKNLMYIFVFFLLSSFIFYCLIKGILNKEEKENKKRKIVSSLIGKVATVKKDIGKTFSIDGIGLVEIDNTVWQAKNIETKLIKENTKVEIVSFENNILNVKVKENAEN